METTQKQIVLGILAHVATGIFVIIIPMFFNVKEVDIYEDDIPT